MGACMHIAGVLCDNCRGYTLPKVPEPPFATLPYTPPAPGTTIHWGAAAPAPVDEKKVRREKIASQILASFANQPERWLPLHIEFTWAEARADAVAEAVRWADALIAELDKEKP